MDDDAPPSSSGRCSSAAQGASSSSSTTTTISTTTTSSTSNWIGASGRKFPDLSDPPSQDGKSCTPSTSSSPSPPFFFATLADTQLGAINDNTSWEDEKQLCRLAVQKLNQLKPRPRFAIVCGDLVHHFPGMYPDTDPSIRERQIADFKVSVPIISFHSSLFCGCGHFLSLKRE